MGKRNLLLGAPRPISMLLPIRVHLFSSVMIRSFVTAIAILAAYSLFTGTRGAEREWHVEKDFRWQDLPVPKIGKTGFTLVPPDQTGITFTNTLTELEGAANRVLFNGSGVAVGDFDRDGLPDIFFCGLDTPNVLYKNLGQWRFKDVTDESGARCSGKNFRGAVFADINGDGWLDLLISSTDRGVLVLLNDGRGKFNDATQSTGIGAHLGATTLALADVDGDGTLDLYVTNYRAADIRDRGRVNMNMVNGQMAVPPEFKDRLLIFNGQVLEFGEPDQLYVNDGRGHFKALPWTDGAFLNEAGKKLDKPPLDWGLTATFRDLNNDGAPDIYVCNDFWSPDRIWLNDGHGHFHAMPGSALRNTSASSMGADFADIDRDGHVDFFVVDMLSRDQRLRRRQMLAYLPATLPTSAVEIRPQFMRNTLFHNRGDGTFEEMANFSGVTASEWSWQPVFIDVDLDGYEDLLIPTGNIKDVQDLDATAAIDARQHSWRDYHNEAERQKAFTQERMVHNRLYPELRTPVVAFRNQHDMTFGETTPLWGTDQAGVHHGIAVADLDGDGDLDFVVNNFGTGAGVYRNESIAPRVAVRLRGLPPNTEGIGAKIKFLGGAVPMQCQEVISGGRYLSGSEPMLVFAAGVATDNLQIEVTWRNGNQSTVAAVKPNRIYEIDEKGAQVGKTTEKAREENELPGDGLDKHFSVRRIQNSKLNDPPHSGASTLFEDISDRLGHIHVDEPFDDFARQPLLPKKFSQLGPGVAWFDVNGDGWDDLIVGSGRGGRLSFFLNDGKGGFKPWQESGYSQVVTRDQSTVLGMHRSPGKIFILTGSENYEDGLALGTSIRQYDLGQKQIDDTLPGQSSTTGPIAVSDIDGDGDLDLFVGGRVVPGRYPEAASSVLYRNTNGRWELDAAATKTLTRVGLVSGAVWSDLDGDGFAELILACEWGPVRVFKNQAGKLREITSELGLDKFTGWWSGVTTGDIDGDGKLDIIATNWGLNSPYHATAEQPVLMYFGPFAQHGVVNIIEAELDSSSHVQRPRRALNSIAIPLPFLRERFPSHKAFCDASLDDVLKVMPNAPGVVSAATLASTIFFNRGTRFEAVELPREAQLAPAFGVNVGDFDGDGHEDIFLSQNFFGTQPEMPRLDSGRGLCLLGNGTSRLSAIPGQVSGIQIYGEQRGSAIADFDGDGRVDLVVTQNGSATRLFHNLGAKPGLRVRLKGPSGNPTGVGATMQLVFPHGKGPVREIHAGSGYWSQDSATQVLGLRETPTQILVSWPGGVTTSTKVPPQAKEITVDSAGGLVTSK